MVDTVVIDRSAENAAPTLEESAKALGIDPTKVDETATEQTATEAPAVPEYIPEKFRNAADPFKAMADAYAELEKKQGKTENKADAPAEKTDEQEADDEGEAEGDPSEAEQAAKDAADKAGLDLNALSDKYWENGSLEDADFEALEKAGYPKHLVEQFIEGRVALVNAQRNTVFSEVGGEDAYNSLTDWARDNLTEAEISAYDKVVNGNDMNAVLMAVKGLKARHEAEAGFEPARAVTGARTRGDTSVYESIAQLQADMGNSKYQNDPAFRAKVEAKLARSSIL